MADTYTFAHLSDLHLTADNGAKRTGPGKLTGMNRNFAKLVRDPALHACDRIVVTGDITDRGHLVAWEYFWKTMQGAGLDMKKILVVPGNHDLCSLRLFRETPTEESRRMAEAGLDMGKQNKAFPWCHAEDNGQVAFFGLNSNNEGNTFITSNAIGKLGFTQLYKLGRMLGEDYAAVPIRIILLHHSPNIPHVATSRSRDEKPMHFLERKTMEMAEDDRRQLRLLGRIFRIKAILHGHTHDSLNRTVNSVRMIAAPPSTEPDRKEKCLRYLLHTIHLESRLMTYRTVKVPA